MTPRAIFFDLDDTLIDGAWTQSAIDETCALLASQCPGLTTQGLIDANREIWRTYWPPREADWTLGRLDGASLSLGAWQLTLRAFDIEDDALAQLAVDTLTTCTAKARRLFEDATGTLLVLQERVPLALITNGAQDTQRGKLRGMGIEAHFAAFGISGELGIAKPDAAIFHHALDRLGVRPDEAWHIGDSLTADVGGAKAAGLTAVWLNRNGRQRLDTDPVPDYEIASLSELLPLLGIEASET